MSDAGRLRVSLASSLVGVACPATCAVPLPRTHQRDRRAFRTSPTGRGLVGAGAAAILLGVLSRLFT